jgi:ribulose-bisphosphate carboxylase small chain
MYLNDQSPYSVTTLTNKESIGMSFIVHRPSEEPGFGITRQEAPGRTIRYTVEGYATNPPEGERYGD